MGWGQVGNIRGDPWYGRPARCVTSMLFTMRPNTHTAPTSVAGFLQIVSTLFVPPPPSLARVGQRSVFIGCFDPVRTDEIPIAEPEVGFYWVF